MSVPKFLLAGVLPDRLPSATASAALACAVCLDGCVGAAVCALLLGMTSGIGAGVVSDAAVVALLIGDMPPLAVDRAPVCRTSCSAVCGSCPSCNSAIGLCSTSTDPQYGQHQSYAILSNTSYDVLRHDLASKQLSTEVATSLGSILMTAECSTGHICICLGASSLSEAASNLVPVLVYYFTTT